MKTIRNNFKPIILCLTLLFSISIYSQKKAKKVKVYKVWVKLTDGTNQKGFLYAVDGESLQIIDNLPLKKESEIAIIKVKDVHQLKIKRKGKMGNSILIGGVSGIAFGGLVGLADGDDAPGWFSFSKEEKVAIGTISFGVLGASYGALAGTGRKKFDIDGNEALFKSIGFKKYAMVKGEKN